MKLTYLLSLLSGGMLALLVLASPNEQPPIGGQLPGSNGFVTDEEFAEVQAEFDEPAILSTGLGPVFNAEACVTCHNQPISGGGSVVTELRTNGGLIHARALNGTPLERVGNADDKTGLRISPSLLGLGFVECIGNLDLQVVVGQQPKHLRGELTMVPLLEAPGKARVGRFGLKSQHASLLSFAGDADFNEKGVTNRLVPGTTPFEDTEDDIDDYTKFMRALNVPTPDVILIKSPEAAKGATIFRSIGCVTCHHETYTTQPAGTPINGGTFMVPKSLGSMTIFPYSDFALHDVGTGDGVQGDKFRTFPLWGSRFRNRLLHDGSAVTRHGAILRHGGQAVSVTDQYKALPAFRQEQLLVFLSAL